MEFVGLFIELLLLGMATYLYLYASGRIKAKDAEMQKKADDFRKNNSWMRILALFFMAVMVVNIVMHLLQWGSV